MYTEVFFHFYTLFIMYLEEFYRYYFYKNTRMLQGQELKIKPLKPKMEVLYFEHTATQQAMDR